MSALDSRGSRRTRPDSARALALRVIRRVVESGAYSNLALAPALRESKLSARDRQFAAELVYGTLRRKLILDAEIARASTRSLRRIDPEAVALLRLGAFQLRDTRVPVHAAVGETVGLSGPRHKGFVNAVLRNLAATPPERPEGATAADISARTGLQPWTVEELGKLLPAGEVEPAAAALASPAALCLRTNSCRTTPEQLIRALKEFAPQPGRLHPDVVQISSAVPSLLPGYQEGWFAVQDESSVVVAAAVEPMPGERILDACAGPGGKAAHLACTVGPTGTVVAADARFHRVELVVRSAERLGVRLSPLVQDAAQPSLRAERFDAVLVDAPCSGVGAARRRPELLWRPEKAQLAGLARLQVSILAGVADQVKPGGRLIYSVCTFPRAETDAAVRAFLAKRPDFEPADVPGPDGPAPVHRLWPHRHGTDAMFFAGFRRTG